MTQLSSAYTLNQLDRPAVETARDFSLAIRLYCDYEQIVDFRMAGVAVLGLDERPPLGHGWGPSPAQTLGAALGADLGGALLRFLRAANVDPLDLRTEVSATFRNDTLGRPHVSGVVVRLTPVLASEEDVAAIPTSERLVEQSAIADSLRSDIGLHVAILPEVRVGARAPARDVVHLVKDALPAGTGRAPPLSGER
jgi:uncharacterized OsmC-like protein